MNKELQDRAWRSLPKEFREELKKRPRYHTLTGYTEADLLYELFGRDKFLPDAMVISGAKVDGNGVTLPPAYELDVKPTPRFKVGDKVTMVGEAKKSYNRVGTIIEVRNNHEYAFYRIKECPVLFAEQYLEPYTEPEPQQTEENMEEKELNLAELLKGCEGDTFYSPYFGTVSIINVRPEENRLCIDTQSSFGRVQFFEDGSMVGSGECVLFPSRDLYLKYPLEAAKAWQEWAESRKPKRWRAKDGEHYYRFDSMFGAVMEMENGGSVDNTYYGHGNYFRTKEEAQQAAEAVKRTLEEFHSKIAEK